MGKGARLRARLSEAAGYTGCSPDLQTEGKGKEAGDCFDFKQASCLPTREEWGWERIPLFSESLQLSCLPRGNRQALQRQKWEYRCEPSSSMLSAHRPICSWPIDTYQSFHDFLRAGEPDDRALIP